VILAALVGWVLERCAGIEHAALPAVLLGMLVAVLVPARAACALPPRAPSPNEDRE
jgi:hypothetical protein